MALEVVPQAKVAAVPAVEGVERAAAVATAPEREVEANLEAVATGETWAAVAVAAAAVAVAVRAVAVMAVAEVEEAKEVVVTVEVLAAVVVAAKEVLMAAADAQVTASTALVEVAEKAQADWVTAAEAAAEQGQSSPATIAGVASIFVAAARQTAESNPLDAQRRSSEGESSPAVPARRGWMRLSKFQCFTKSLQRCFVTPSFQVCRLPFFNAYKRHATSTCAAHRW